MFRRFGLLCATLALFSIAGGHWAVLQSVVWVGMIHDYTQKTGSVATAVEQTFDGQHPCELCRQIATAKRQEKAKDGPAAPGKEKTSKSEQPVKAIATDDRSFRRERQPVGFSKSRFAAGVLLTRADQPPTPPPRSAIGA